VKSHFKSTMQKSRKRGLKHWQKCDGSSQWTLCVKRYVFNERLKTASDELWRITSGRLFHARGPATEKSQYPMLSVVSPAQQCCPMSSELAARYTHPWSSLNPSFKSWIMRCELVWHEFKWYPMWITYWPHLRQGSPRHIQLFCISIVFFVWLFGGIRFYFSISVTLCLYCTVFLFNEFEPGDWLWRWLMGLCCLQGRTPLDVSDPDVETLLEELQKQQELVSTVKPSVAHLRYVAVLIHCKIHWYLHRLLNRFRTSSLEDRMSCQLIWSGFSSFVRRYCSFFVCLCIMFISLRWSVKTCKLFDSLSCSDWPCFVDEKRHGKSQHQFRADSRKFTRKIRSAKVSGWIILSHIISILSIFMIFLYVIKVNIYHCYSSLILHHLVEFCDFSHKICRSGVGFLSQTNCTSAMIVNQSTISLHY